MDKPIEVRSLTDLDKLVAEKVMGWTVAINEVNWRGCHIEYYQSGFPVIGDLPSYSTDIAAAWTIAEKLHIGVIPYFADRSDSSSFQWVAGIVDDNIYIDQYGAIDGHLGGVVIAEAPPIAICLAALKTVGIEVELRFIKYGI